MLALVLGLTAAASGAPVLSIVSGPDGPTNDNEPAFEFEYDAESGTTVECSIDPVDTVTPSYGPCTGDSTHVATEPLVDGAYTFRVRATDTLSEQTVAERSFTVDTVAPAVSIVSGPNGPVSDDAPSFGFSGESEADFECSVDQGSADYGPCSTTNSHTPPTLADGSYTFRVRATDAAGNVSSPGATRTFRVDTVAPAVPTTTGPDGPVSDDTPSFGFNGESGATFECSVDQGSADYGPCSTADSHTPPTLADGSYTFRVRANDAAGNVGPAATRTFRVDTLAPDTTINSQPYGTTDDQSPTFEFDADEDVDFFECSLDEEDFEPCNSPKHYSGLDPGQHSFAVRATDDAGNRKTEPAVENFKIDLDNPTLAIISGPPAATNDTKPEFRLSFDADAGTTVECSIDPVAQGTPSYGPCNDGDGHIVSTSLTDGAYVFRVKARDGVPTHQTIETRAFTVDTFAPSTTIGSGPAGPTNSANPSFTFGASESGVSFECRRDGEDFAPCSSPKDYALLPDGTHDFYVLATDAAGNESSVPAHRNFEIDTVAPTVSITFGPSGTTSDDSPLFEFSVADPGVSAGQPTVECSIDQGVPSFGACSSVNSHVTARRLADGGYTFRVRASDAAGNTTTATRSFSVATGAIPPPSPPLPLPPPPPAAQPSARLLSPFPLVRLAGSLTRKGVKVRILTVRGPRGSLVNVRIRPYCSKAARARKAPRCAAKRSSGKVGAKGAVRFKRLEVGYPAGTVLEIRVSQAGLIGKYTRFVVRRGKGPRRVDRCLMPGAKTGSRCPVK